MSFNETIESMGYVITDKSEGKITVERKLKYARIVVIFNTELKYIDPVLIPESMIYNASIMKAVNEAWEHLKIDVEAFKLHSGYRLLNLLV